MTALTEDEARQSRRLLACAISFFVLSMIALLTLVVLMILGCFIDVQNLTLLPKILFPVAAAAGAAGFAIARTVRNSFTTASDKALIPAVQELLGEAIRNSSDPVAEFTRLSGLVGATGIFRKLELSGMPLATILMTLAFCLFPIGIAALKNQQLIADSGDISSAFIDMAKLTLGAFIGSFVTKSSTRDTETARASATAAAKAVAATKP